MSNYLVLGGGISGLDAAKLLARQGRSVLLSDKNVIPDVIKKQLKSANIQTHEGPQDFTLLNKCEAIVLSPGVPYDLSLLETARWEGIPLYSEIEYALANMTPNFVIGVTGTNGKSTVCMMVNHILTSYGIKSICLGNIGVSLSSVAVGDVNYECLVLELSSYQLDHSHTLALDAAVFTTFSFDHMARHKTLYNYFAAKWKITSMLRPGGFFIITKPIELLASQFGLSAPSTCNVIVVDYPEIFGELPFFPLSNGQASRQIFTIQEDYTISNNESAKVADLCLAHQAVSHNKLNALLAACSVTSIIIKPLNLLLDKLQDYQHLPFRCQLVHSIKGHPIINDSKSTNVESAVFALQGQQEPVLLLLGGKPKGESYTPLIQIKSRIKRILAFGEASKTIYSELQSEISVMRYDTLRSCLEDLFSQYCVTPAPILFSPACASFDEFDNFEHRGRFFNMMVQSAFAQTDHCIENFD